MSDEFNPWLGYTPMSKQGLASMRNLWKNNDLPEPANDFVHWSAEYAREIWTVVHDFLEPANELTRDDLIDFLYKMDVWNDDVIEQQWAPKRD